MKIKNLFLVAGILSCTLMSAQIGDVAPPVPGVKIDHKGLPLNPTPSGIWVSSGEGPSADGTFVLKGDKKLFPLGKFIASGNNGTPLTLKINSSSKYFAKSGMEAVSGAYILTVGVNSVEITGFDKAGVFYGLQTLRQVIADKKGGNLPVMTVCDEPTLPLRS